MTTEIGGYFGLDLPDHGDPFVDAIAFQSGRSGLEAVLSASSFRTAWIPAFVCDTVVNAARRAGLEIELYNIDETFAPVGLPAKLPRDAVVIYVNYFGLCLRQVRKLTTDLPPEQIVIDNSHALFAPHGTARASVYSPRKFAGLPDGGLVRCAQGVNLPAPTEQDHDSIGRMNFLLRRASESARAGYGDFHTARQSLNGVPPRGMSSLTRRLLRSVDWNQVKHKRRRHFARMNERLARRNAFHWSLDPQDVPLCYPLRVPGIAAGQLQGRLAAMDIFVPIYWPDAAQRLARDNWEAQLMSETLHLPLDQRMSEQDVDLVCDRVATLLSETTGGSVR